MVAATSNIALLAAKGVRLGKKNSPKNQFLFNNLLKTHFKRKYTIMELLLKNKFLPLLRKFLKLDAFFLREKTLFYL